MTASPESDAIREILLLCARVRLRPSQEERLRAPVLHCVDWSNLIAAATAHAILPLLYHHLNEVCPNETPTSQMQSLRSAFELNVRRNLFFATELLRILAEFTAGGIASIPWKGPGLAAAVYGDLALREFWDLDLLVPQRDIQRAQEVLSTIGYTARFRSDLAGRYMGQYPFFSARGGLFLELHSELTLRHFPRPVDFSPLLERMGTVPIGGTSVPNLSVEDNLIFLCMHGAKDFWARLSWVCDVSELLGRFPEIDWDTVQRRSADLGVARMVRVGLALASELLDAELPQEVRRKVEADATACRLACEISARMFPTPPQYFGLAEQFIFRVRTAENLKQGLRYGARLALAPTEEDVLFYELPRSLSFAYPLLRPIRFLRSRFALRSRNDQTPKTGPEHARIDAP
jgi:hypothetical protein